MQRARLRAKLRYREKILESFRNVISQEWHIKYGALILFLSYFSNDDYVHYQNMIFMKIVITNFRKNLRKLSWMLFNRI